MRNLRQLAGIRSNNPRCTKLVISEIPVSEGFSSVQSGSNYVNHLDMEKLGYEIFWQQLPQEEMNGKLDVALEALKHDIQKNRILLVYTNSWFNHFWKHLSENDEIERDVWKFVKNPDKIPDHLDASTHTLSLDVLEKAYEQSFRKVGIVAFAEALQFNHTIIELNMSVSDAELVVIAAALKENHTITNLTVFTAHDYSPKCKGITALAKILKTNNSITKLSCMASYVGDHGAKKLAQALKVNSTLTNLSLDECHIGFDGYAAFDQALMVNKNLRFLNLSRNTHCSSNIFYKSLKVNRTLYNVNINNYKMIEYFAWKKASAENTLIFACREGDVIRVNESLAKGAECSLDNLKAAAEKGHASVVAIILAHRPELEHVKFEIQCSEVATLFPELVSPRVLADRGGCVAGEKVIGHRFQLPKQEEKENNTQSSSQTHETINPGRAAASFFTPSSHVIANKNTANKCCIML